MNLNYTDPDKINRQKIFIIRFLYWGIILFCAAVFAKYILPVLFPFIIACLIAVILNKPINYISNKTHIKRKAVSLFAVLFFYVVAGGILVWIFTLGVHGVIHIFSFLPDIFETLIIPVIHQTLEKAEQIFTNVNPSIINMVESDAFALLETFRSWIIQFSETILSSVTEIVSQVPSFFMKTVITIIVTFFITMDFQNMADYVTRQIPKTKLTLLDEIKTFLFRTLPKFIVNYGLILFMTFMELFIGLKILKVPYAGIIAFVIAILDILPVLGTGGVLIPWSIVSLILGDFITAAGIIILYIVITVIRNIVEPRLIGKQMGLHPVVTLAAMLVGLNLFGIVGLFGFPILFSFLKNHSVKKKEDLCYNDNSEEGGRKDE